MKYIMFRTREGREVPVIFPKDLVHSEVAAALSRLSDLRHATVDSAGEIGQLLVVGTVGKSTTLGVAASPEDAQVINSYDYAFGLDTGNLAHIEDLAQRAMALTLAGIIK